MSIRQTDDDRAFRIILEGAGLAGCALDRLGNCRLIAFLGANPVGVLSLETDLDCAVIRLFCVLAPYRRRRIGSSLLIAARTAARTRGVRTIYTSSFDAPAFLQAAGFTRANRFPSGLPSLPVDASPPPWELDISQDGIILR